MAASDVWALGALLSFIGNGGNHLFMSEHHVKSWSGGKSTLNYAFYTKNLIQLIADLLNPMPSLRPTAQTIRECTLKNGRQNVQYGR